MLEKGFHACLIWIMFTITCFLWTVVITLKVFIGDVEWMYNWQLIFYFIAGEYCLRRFKDAYKNT